MDEVRHLAVGAVIGDVVGSRTATDRGTLHARLTDALTATTPVDRVRPGCLEPFGVTVGDEFQGTFDTVGAALDACLAVRLRLLPEVDVRFGVGWGPVTVLDAERGTQDGPGWWAARAAIDAVRRSERTAATRLVRTAYRRADDIEGPPEPAVAAALLCRDHLLGSLDDRSREVVTGLMAGRTQSEIAETLGISGSAVSQRVRTDGLGILIRACEQLREVR